MPGELHSRCARGAVPLALRGATAGEDRRPRDTGDSTRALVTEHEPVIALAEAGIRERASLIVVGTGGVGGFTGPRLGSTVLNVFHHGGLPTVFVPPQPK